MNDYEEYEFSTPEELGNILDEIEKKAGLPPMPPQIGRVELTYRIKDREFVGSFGVFIGESPQEKVESYRQRAVEALQACATAAIEHPIDDADKEWGETLRQDLEGCSEKDTEILTWDYEVVE